jgi:O-acetyl-ADP-ribose deacetylase (regulator of RNase III)
MIKFTTGNLLNTDAEALVNTVNTVGVMGKGIALMFKELFPDNFRAYSRACEAGEVKVGQVHVFDRGSFLNPRYIINFPTKKHWRHPSKMEWIVDGLRDLKTVIRDKNIKSIALPPLGAGNGKLNWDDVKSVMIDELTDIGDVDITVFEPTEKYQNVSKRSGVEKLTPARAVVAELIRRYWILGIECSILEVQKLAWFAERFVKLRGAENVLDLRFSQNRYGPYAQRLSHLLDSLDGSYLHCSKRIADSSPSDLIWVEDTRADRIAAYLRSEGKEVTNVIDATEQLIDGFQSPLGLELLSTVDWIINVDGVEPELAPVRQAVARWPGGKGSAERKARLFNDRLIELALDRLKELRADGAVLPDLTEEVGDNRQ